MTLATVARTASLHATAEAMLPGIETVKTVCTTAVAGGSVDGDATLDEDTEADALDDGETDGDTQEVRPPSPHTNVESASGSCGMNKLGDWPVALPI